MKRNQKKTIDQFVERHLRLFNTPPVQESIEAKERAQSQLGVPPAEAVEGRSEIAEVSAVRPGKGWRLAMVGAVSAVLLAVLIPIALRPPAAATLEVAERSVRFNETVESKIYGEVVKLKDGSRIEMRKDSVLVLERADDGVRIRLDQGDIFVNAAKQHGHLYVQTKDVIVSVVGTVFYVKVAREGSRVAVFEGEVQVKQGQSEKKLGPGDHVASNSKMESIPVTEQVAWSREAATHMASSQQISPGPTPKEEKLAFEEATVRPAAPLPPAGPNARGGGGGDGRPGGPCVRGTELDPSRLRVIHAPLFEIVAYAYGECRDMMGDPLNIIRPYPRLSSVGPDWIKSEPWDIEALIPKGAIPMPANGELAARLVLDGSPAQKMLRTLLEERFKLLVRRESREMPVYVLTVGPDGTKFQGAGFNYGTAAIITRDMIPPGGDRFSVKPATAADGAPITRIGPGPCIGAQSTPLPDRCNDAIYTNVTMDAVVFSMSGDAGKLILNKTGIQEKVSFLFELPRRQYVGTVPQPISFQDLARGLETVGLKLTQGRAPVEFYVIERAEKPSEN